MDSVEFLSRTTKPEHRPYRSATWIVLVIVLAAASWGGWLAIGRFRSAFPVVRDDEKSVAPDRSLEPGKADALSADGRADAGLSSMTPTASHLSPESTKAKAAQRTVDGPGRNVKLPDLRQLPFRLGLWQGEHQPVSREILAQTGADDGLVRIYRTLEGKAISAYLVPTEK
jgi:hypothetical protein